MRTLLTLCFAIFLSLTLSGCLQTTKLVTRTTTLYQEVPSELTVRVTPKPPLDKVLYLAMPVYERESYLANYSVQTLRDLHSCNAQLDAISVLSRKWKENPP